MNYHLYWNQLSSESGFLRPARAPLQIICRGKDGLQFTKLCSVNGKEQDRGSDCRRRKNIWELEEIQC